MPQLNFDFSKNVRRILIILGTVLLVFVIFADYGFLKRIELEQQSQELYEQIQIQNHIKDSINNNIYKLSHDTTEIERIAREKYGMVKPNEEVYHIKKK